MTSGVKWATFPGVGSTILLHLGVRFYEPGVGRFSQVDPAYDEVNLYAYGQNSPLLASDPYGLFCVWFGQKTQKIGKPRLCFMNQAEVDIATVTDPLLPTPFGEMPVPSVQIVECTYTVAMKLGYLQDYVRVTSFKCYSCGRWYTRREVHFFTGDIWKRVSKTWRYSGTIGAWWDDPDDFCARHRPSAEIDAWKNSFD